MNDEQPYDEPWGDLPLPDAGKAWQKMERLLDEDDRRRRVLPWWFWRRAVVALALFGVLAGGWWWLQPTGKEAEKKTVLSKKNEQQAHDGQQQATAMAGNKKSTAKRVTSLQQSATPNETNVANPVTPMAAPPPISKPAFLQEGKKHPPTAGIVSAKVNQPPYGERRKTTSQKDPPLLPPVKKSGNSNGEEAGGVRKKDADVALQTETSGKDSLQQTALPKKDSTTAKDSVKTATPPVVQIEEKKKTPKKKPSFLFSAGIGLQQAIAVHHQPASPPDSLGRKRGFFDYYPSVYAKVRHGRWAAQVDVQYSVPQPVANFAFSQKTTYDATSGVVETERLNLQKLYYHQLSLSVNYDVLPQWSAGLGGAYNIFAGAVTEREFNDKYTATGAEAVYKFTEPIKGYKDSFFYKTTAALLLQTDYHWKRFSLGLRYTQNLQPFVKYTAPNGDVLDRKNNALQAVLRFRLWTSK